MSLRDGHFIAKALAPLVAVLLSPGRSGEVAVVASVSPELTDRIQAGSLVKAVTAVLGGGGGGRPEMAQGKGADATKVDAASAAAQDGLRAAGLAD